jgi:hypothetical protein
VIKGLVDVHNEAGQEVIAKGETAYVPLPKAAPQKIKIKPGLFKPVEKSEVVEVTAVTAVTAEEEESTSLWWWLLGIVGIALLI